MKVFVLTFVALLALCDARVFDPQRDETRTRWMDRKVLNMPGRITNGQPAQIADFPYMLALLDISPSWGGFICGASAIAQHWSLTAAHCLDRNTPPQFINLRGGSTNRNTGGFIFFASNYWNHPSYNTRTLEYDIALVQTQNDSPITGQHVAPVAIAPLCPTNANSCCQVCGGTTILVSGWGRLETGASSPTLNQLTAPVHDFRDCGTRWSNIGPSFFCKAVIDGRDTCSGDSGSPLVTGTGANRVQQGVVSFGTSVCGDGTRPSVNVRVEHPEVRNWINQLSGL